MPTASASKRFIRMFLRRCDRLDKEKDEIGEEQISNFFEDLEKLRNMRPVGWKLRNQVLYAQLAGALTIRRCSKASKTFRKAYKNRRDEAKIRASRKGSNRFLEYVRFCVPERTRQDYSRYAQAVRAGRIMVPREFAEKIEFYDGGLTRFVRDHPASKKSTQ